MKFTPFPLHIPVFWAVLSCKLLSSDGFSTARPYTCPETLSSSSSSISSSPSSALCAVKLLEERTEHSRSKHLSFHHRHSFGAKNKNNNNSSRQLRKMPLTKLAQLLEEDLWETQWFVTGDVIPEYFCEEFRHGDPNIKLSTLQEYITSVRSLFDRQNTKAEIVCTDIDPNRSNIITCQWRLSGKLNLLGRALHLKPFIVHTDFSINENGKIQRQQDRSSIPLWDIALSTVFPFLNGVLTAPEAPPVEPRIKTASKMTRPGILPYFLLLSARRPSEVSHMAHHSKSPLSLTKDNQEVDVVAHEESTASPLEEHANDLVELYAYSDRGTQEFTCDHISGSRPGRPLFNDLLGFSEDTHHMSHSVPMHVVQHSSSSCPKSTNKSHSGRGNQEFTHDHISETGPRRPLFNDLLGLFEDNHQTSHAVAMHAVQQKSSSSYHKHKDSKNKNKHHEPIIRVMLDDGTDLPRIRAPTLLEKAKRFAPDRATTRHHLLEACRRTSLRRASRF